MYSTMLHQHPTAPWAGPFTHPAAVDTARRVAADVVRHQRWGAGNEGQPVYDVAGEGAGRYVGDYAEDAVRANMCGRIVLSNRRPISEVHETEVVYRLLMPDAAAWHSLYAYLSRLVEVGRLTADEPVEAAANRAFRNGHTVKTLHAELAARRAAAS